MSEKIYCYIDESGQDTFGELFIVAVVVVGSNREQVEAMLAEAERVSLKGRRKWIQCRKKHRASYLQCVLAHPDLFKGLYFAAFKNQTQYEESAIDATALAINHLKIKNYKATVLVDGKVKARQFGAALRKRHITVRKVTGVRKEEHDAIMRLADALAGGARNFINQNDTVIAEIIKQAIASGLIVQVCAQK